MCHFISSKRESGREIEKKRIKLPCCDYRFMFVVVVVYLLNNNNNNKQDGFFFSFAKISFPEI